MSEPTTTSTFALDNDPLVDESNSGENANPKEEPDRVDLGNHENDEEVDYGHINDDGHLVDKDGNKMFTTTEEAIKDGSFVLDAEGRMPGLYLTDLEKLQRRAQSEAVEKAFGAASEGRNSVVERQVNVANSGIPPITVQTKQEHPVSGDAKTDDAEVPVLESNPNAAE